MNLCQNISLRKLTLIAIAGAISLSSGCITKQCDHTINVPPGITGSTLSYTVLYGTSIEFTEDITLGSLPVGTQVELIDKFVGEDHINRPIIKVKVISSSGYGEKYEGRVGWIVFSDTDMTDLYDPVSKLLDPWRMTLTPYEQNSINQILKNSRSKK